MTLITEQAALDALCRRLGAAAHLAIDTEFMRESTYWPQLCLIQVAGPDEAAAIDPMAPGLDLKPFLDLLYDPAILKVFHAGRQDIEIFHHMTGRVPLPLFDTQIAAMVCGFGDQVGYEQLVASLTGIRIDKSSRFSDWSHRPLAERQIRYALADVVHLRPVYEALQRRVESAGRASWIAAEMTALAQPENYVSLPEDAWRRLKVRSFSPRFLGVLKAVAAWREREAQARNLPRGRVLRDEALPEIAGHPPKTIAELLRIRSMNRGLAEGRQGEALLAAIAEGLAAPLSVEPGPEPRRSSGEETGPLVELLRVLLRLRSDESGVAQRLIANAADLEQIAGDDRAPVSALTGWRYEIFGRDALALKQGRIALRVERGQVRAVETDAASAPARAVGV